MLMNKIFLSLSPQNPPGKNLFFFITYGCYQSTTEFFQIESESSVVLRGLAEESFLWKHMSLPRPNSHINILFRTRDHVEKSELKILSPGSWGTQELITCIKLDFCDTLWLLPILNARQEKQKGYRFQFCIRKHFLSVRAEVG